jgi:beta-glucosidase-like glycosyl hydrolase
MCLFAFLALAAPAWSAAPPSPPRDDAARIEHLLARRTPEEKFGQLEQVEGDPNTGRLLDGQRDLIRQGGLGSLLSVRGACNVNAVQHIAVEESSSKIPILFGFDVIHGYRTIFPIPLGEASSWDPAAVERAARIAAAEASAAGVRWVFAPMADVARDPRWGRIAEGSGEDPYLGSAMARARVRGFQGDDYHAARRVVACAKHWVAYGAAEAGREYNGAFVPERTLREVYFPPFRAALEAGVGTLMTSLNTVNGIPATAHPFTLGKVLRGEWKFDGLVVSDYNAVKQLVTHGMAADESDAARLALLAGIDMEEESRVFATHGPQLIKDGRIPPARVDEAVRRVLQLKLRLGLFDQPYIPRVVGQVPIYYSHLNTGRPASPDDRYTSKYIDAPVTPLFPFGHGLSYTRFRLSDLHQSARGIRADGSLDVHVTVENIGDRAGDEVVQLYNRDIAASVARPVKELRGFERVTLRPGEKRSVQFTLTPRELGFYDRGMRFVVEPEEFRVTVGTSSVWGIEAGFQVIE